MEKIKQTLDRIQPIAPELLQKTQERLDNLTKPQGSLGVLEELAKKVVAITGNENPKLENKVVFTLACDHGVAEEGVSAFPQEVTPQMVLNFLNGGAGINVLSRHVGARVVVVDIGVAADMEPHPQLVDRKIAKGTKNITKGPAMSRKEAVKSIEVGIDLVKEELKNGVEIIGVGEMGIANTTPASAIEAAITSEPVENVTGRGTGITDDVLKNKVKVIEKALEVNKPDKGDPIDVLAKVGGFEIGGLAGIILESAANGIPVVLDGFEPGVAALIAAELAPNVKDYIIAPHCSEEIGDKIILMRLGLTPFLDLKLRLGEGTGAVLGMTMIEAGVKILTEMASFKEAGVSERDD